MRWKEEAIIQSDIPICIPMNAILKQLQSLHLRMEQPSFNERFKTTKHDYVYVFCNPNP